VAIVLRERRAAKGNFDNRRLTMLAVILLIQATMDLSIPNVSFSAHASGFVVGLILMLALSPRARPVSAPTSVPPSKPNPTSSAGPQA
jgi:membrane associated rhomboid family serine protease